MSVNRKFNFLDNEKLGTFNTSFVPSLTAFRVYLQGDELLRSHRVDVDWNTTLRDQGAFGLNIYLDERDFMNGQNKTGGIRRSWFKSKYCFSKKWFFFEL